jgi:hypothetical protein
VFLWHVKLALLLETRACVALTQGLEGRPMLGELLRDTLLGRDDGLVEMESLQFVGCSWFIGLIGLVSDSPRINSSQPNYVRSHAPLLSPLAHT